MNRRGANVSLLAALAFALGAPLVVGSLSSDEVFALAPELPAQSRRAQLDAAREASIDLPLRAAVSDRTAIATLPIAASSAATWRCLADTLKQRTAGPAEWEAQLASCADEWKDADRGLLRAGAIDARLSLPERLAALELLRALGERASVQLPQEHEQQLLDNAFGPDAHGTTCWAAVSASAAFASPAGCDQLLDALDGGDPSRTSVALHGLRNGARACLLRKISERLVQASDSDARIGLAAAAQSVARARELLFDEPVSLQAQQFLDLACDSELPPRARRNLLLAVASLGDPRTELQLCDLATDPTHVESRLASEAARALRASPSPRLAQELDLRLRAATLDVGVREKLVATRDALKQRESLAFNPSASLR